ncbi:MULTISPECIES: hypothetical protein [unclassified Bradyrhizobium]|uniref:hypothetical protein n=1 Tax=unclassified Bradyrhizobium TaxID=2631580 RepID=UPI001CD3AC13|nr:MULTISPECIES: hypothetical protein [unclassified Bradyrhizobium]MCA1375832.1 hypothetical protein [Bradyrhizobium sp. IC4060]MCA1485572.1 hypothetical protein [Bradyrhizobium sp. IC4061]
MASLPIRELTTEVLEEISPDETFLVQSYDPDSSKGSGGSTSKGPQGFGAGDAIVILLPFIFDFFKKFGETIASELGKSTYAAAANWFVGGSEGEDAARVSIIESLKESGVPSDAIEKATVAILTSLKKHRR